MSIKRNGVGDYERATKHFTERKEADFDLRFEFPEGATSIYVLGEGEWWDPRTSTKYWDGVSHHAMRGPSVVCLHCTSGGHRESVEYHVNDPRVWVWVSTNIKNGDFNAANCQVLFANRQAVEIRPEPPKVRAKKKAAAK